MITLGPEYYERATAPLWLALLLLMGVAPLTAWGAAGARSLGRRLWKPGLFSFTAPLLLLLVGGIQRPAVLLAAWFGVLLMTVTISELCRGAMGRSRKYGENLPLALVRMVRRNRRRYGGVIIHLGVIVMAAGIIGIEAFQIEAQGSIPPGGKIDIGRYSLEYDSVAVFDTYDNRNVTQAVVEVYRDGRSLGELYPRQDFFYQWGQSMMVPALHSTLAGDLYVIFFDWQPGVDGSASFQLYYNPLINWLWLGALVFIGGTLMAAWPEKKDTVRARSAGAGKITTDVRSEK